MGEKRTTDTKSSIADVKRSVQRDIASCLGDMGIETVPDHRGYVLVVPGDLTVEATPLPDGAITVSVGVWDDGEEDTREFAWQTWDDVTAGKSDVPYDAAAWIRDGLEWMGLV